MIIDAHTHAHPQADGFGQRFDASLTALLDALGDGPAEMAVLLPIAPRVSNAFVAQACATYPDRLVGFASVDPHNPEARKELHEAVEAMGLRGLKLHPRIQGVGLADADILIPLVEAAHDLRIPVLIDAFPCGPDWFRLRELELISILAERIPQARIILAHAGGHRVLETMLVAKAHANVWIDISFTPTYYQGTSIEHDLVQVMRKLGPGRLIYGSDHPEVSMRASHELAKALLDRAGFDAKDVDAVMGGNITSLLSWRNK